MALQIATTSQFSNSPTTFFNFQNWNFNPVSFTEIFSFIGINTTSALVVATQIKNYINDPGTAIYSEYRVTTTVEYLEGNVEWINITGAISGASSPGYLLSNSNLLVNTTINFQNLNNIPSGNRVARVLFTVKGKLSNDTFQTVDTIPYFVKLYRLGFGDVLTSPAEVNFFHIIGQTLPAAIPVTINCLGAFNLFISKDYYANGGNITFAENFETTRRFSGTGTQTVNIYPTISIENLGVSNPFHTSEFLVVKAAGQQDSTVVRMVQQTTPYYVIDETALTFNAIKQVQEASPQVLNLIGIGTFTITKPSWLTVTPLSGSNIQQITVSPVSSANLQEAVYVGKIIIDVSTDSKNIEIDVIYTVLGAINLGALTTGVNFTDDDSTISSFHNPFAKKATILIDTLAYDYDIALSTAHLNQFETVFNKNKAEFYLGSVIKRCMKSLKDPIIGINPLGMVNSLIFSVKKYYNPSFSKVIASLDTVTAIPQVLSTTYNELYFIKGRRPSRISVNLGIIDYNESAIRVTKNSFHLLNLYSATSRFRIIVLRNNQIVNTSPPLAGSAKLAGFKINFNTFLPGDIIEAILVTQTPTSVNGQDVKGHRQKYIVFPTCKYSNNIAWEDEHGLMQVLEFTGNYVFSAEIEGKTKKVYKNFTEVFEKYGHSQEVLLECNTGWILKENQERIDSLMKSKKAWLYRSNNNYLSIIPVSSKIVNDDSNQATYAYNVEFKINPKNDFENFTF